MRMQKSSTEEKSRGKKSSTEEKSCGKEEKIRTPVYHDKKQPSFGKAVFYFAVIARR